MKEYQSIKEYQRYQGVSKYQGSKVSFGENTSNKAQEIQPSG